MYVPSVFQTDAGTVRILLSPQNLFSLKLTHVQACDKHPSCSASTATKPHIFLRKSKQSKSSLAKTYS